eukprot:scaffold17932_cov58-Phaeocystis_antarctica.AAC.5
MQRLRSLERSSPGRSPAPRPAPCCRARRSAAAPARPPARIDLLEAVGGAVADGDALGRGVPARARYAQATSVAEGAGLVVDEPLAGAVLLASVGRLVHDARLAHDAIVRGPRRQQAVGEAKELEHLLDDAVGTAL